LLYMTILPEAPQLQHAHVFSLRVPTWKISQLSQFCSHRLWINKLKKHKKEEIDERRISSPG
jgi:hypothetical protein